MTTTLQRLFEAFPDKPWNLSKLSRNPCFPGKLIEKYESLPWNIEYLLLTSRISENFILKYSNKIVDWTLATITTNIKFILSHPDLNWKWEYIGMNYTLTIDDIINNPEINSRLRNMHRNITFEEVFENYLEYPYIELLSCHPKITIDFIIKHKYKAWDWDALARHKSISINDILNNYNLSWNWNGVASRPDITSKLIKDHPDKQGFWTWNPIYTNVNFTPKDILDIGDMGFRFLDVPTKWNWISYNPNIDIKFVLKYKDRPWNFIALSKNPGITFKDILDHPELPWIWNSVSQNPNLKYEDIVNNPHLGWNWDCLSWNRFELDPTLMSLRQLKLDKWKKKIDLAFRLNKNTTRKTERFLIYYAVMRQLKIPEHEISRYLS